MFVYAVGTRTPPSLDFSRFRDSLWAHANITSRLLLLSPAYLGSDFM